MKKVIIKNPVGRVLIWAAMSAYLGFLGGAVWQDHKEPGLERCPSYAKGLEEGKNAGRLVGYAEGLTEGREGCADAD